MGMRSRRPSQHTLLRGARRAGTGYSSAAAGAQRCYRQCGQPSRRRKSFSTCASFVKRVPARALHATGQILTWGRDEAVVLFLLHHSNSGQVAATFRLSLAYVERGGGRSAPWPEIATRAASALTCEAPKDAQPQKRIARRHRGDGFAGACARVGAAHDRAQRDHAGPVRCRR